MEKLKRLRQKHKKVPKTHGCEEDIIRHNSATSENKVTKSNNLNYKKTELIKQKIYVNRDSNTLTLIFKCTNNRKRVVWVVCHLGAARYFLL